MVLNVLYVETENFDDRLFRFSVQELVIDEEEFYKLRVKQIKMAKLNPAKLDPHDKILKFHLS